MHRTDGEVSFELHNHTSGKVDPMDKYSQNDEQQYILEACAGITDGKFLDIGAFHPIVFSNTRALFECGWGGVMVEPGPAQMRNLLEEYGGDDRIKLVSAAVSVSSEWYIAELHVTDDGTSTTDNEAYIKWKDTCHFVGRMYVPVITVSEILNRFGRFDFVSIDTEGTNLLVLRQLLNETQMRPVCICVEYDGQLEECCELAFGKGYTQTYLSGENAVYVLA